MEVKENFQTATALFSILHKILSNRNFIFFCDLGNNVSEELPLSTPLLKSVSYPTNYTTSHLRRVWYVFFYVSCV